MSSAWGEFTFIIIGMFLIQIVSSLLMIISIWFSSGCEMNIKYIGAVTSIAPLLCAIGLACYELARSFFGITGVLVYVIGYIWMLVALIINQIHTPQCIKKYAKVFLWFSISLAIINCIIPLIYTLLSLYRSWRSKKLNKDMKEILMHLYEARDPLGIKARVEKLGDLSYQLPEFLSSEPFSPEEISLILKNHGLIFTSDDDVRIECQSCGEALKKGGEYAQIPGCSHIACKGCMEKLGTSTIYSKNCDVCDNNVRMAFLNKAQGEETIKFIMNNPEEIL